LIVSKSLDISSDLPESLVGLGRFGKGNLVAKAFTAANLGQADGIS